MKKVGSAERSHHKNGHGCDRHEDERDHEVGDCHR
jgi:hypothetical protein